MSGARLDLQTPEMPKGPSTATPMPPVRVALYSRNVEADELMLKIVAGCSDFPWRSDLDIPRVDYLKLPGEDRQ